MRKNILGALVIFVVTIAFLMVIIDISKPETLPKQSNVQKSDASGLAIFDDH